LYPSVEVEIRTVPQDGKTLRLLVFKDKCRYCHERHQHGGGYAEDGPVSRYLGHRVAHCSGWEHGYILVLAPEAPTVGDIFDIVEALT
jgi:hypothetical protein